MVPATASALVFVGFGGAEGDDDEVEEDDDEEADMLDTVQSWYLVSYLFCYGSAIATIPNWIRIDRNETNDITKTARDKKLKAFQSIRKWYDREQQEAKHIHRYRLTKS